MANLIIHRGIHDNIIKENTYLSVSRALNNNSSKGAEFDIRLTKDNFIVLMHDHSINRTSNGRGYVENSTLKELQKYNYGSITFPQTIPTLNQILNIQSNKIFLIEIKPYHNERLFAEKITEVLKNYSNKNIYLTSFNKKSIKILNKISKNLKLGFLVYFKKDITYHKYYNFILAETINQKVANKLIKTNKEIFFYHINEKKDITKIEKYFPKDYQSKLYFITDKISFI